MKKYQVVILILLISAIHLFSQESGWEITDRIKNQKLLLKDLVDLCVSPDSNYIYTAHYWITKKNERISRIYKWDINTGKYLDSIITPSQIPINFSSDGKYLMMVSNNFYNLDTFKTNIYIYDIEYQKVKIQLPFSTPGDFNIKNGLGQYYSYVQFKNFDFDEYHNQLFLNIYAKYFEYFGAATSGSRTYYHLGGSSLFKINGNSLELIEQYSSDNTFSNIKIKDKQYISCMYGFENSSSSGSAYSEKIKYSNYIKSFTNNENTLLTKVDYEFSKDYGTGKPQTSWSKGDSNAFKYLFYNKDKNKLVSTYGNKLLYFNLDIWKMRDSLITVNLFNLASYCNEGRYILNVVRDSLIIINVTDKFVDETIKLPFAPNKIKLLKNDANLLIFNNAGNFAIVSLPKCYNINSVPAPKVENEKLIKKYDSEEIELSQEKIKDLKNSQIQIFDILGKTVLSINADMLKSNSIIDISNLKSGLYFIKYRDGVEKLIK